MAFCDPPDGFVVVDYVLAQSDGGPGPAPALRLLKPFGALAVTTVAPGLRGIVVPAAREGEAHRVLSEFYEAEEGYEDDWDGTSDD